MSSTTTKLIIANLGLGKIGARRITTFGATTTEEGRLINNCYAPLLDELLEENIWSFAQKRVALVDMTEPEDYSDWVTGTVYTYDALAVQVVYDPTLAKYYKLKVTHTASALFATDLALNYWELRTDWATSTVYAVGANVYNSGISYVCLVHHTSGTFATDLTATSPKWIATETLAMTEDNVSVIYYKPSDWVKGPNIQSSTNAIVRIEGARILSDTAGLKIGYTYHNDDPTTYQSKFITAFASRIAAELCFSIANATAKAKDVRDVYENVDLPRAIAADSQQGTPIGMQQDSWELARMGGGIIARPGDSTWHPVD
jgi:hypothetical protein